MSKFMIIVVECKLLENLLHMEGPEPGNPVPAGHYYYR
jgi:hypothetical protein